jgi:hypothetical protein
MIAITPLYSIAIPVVCGVQFTTVVLFGRPAGCDRYFNVLNPIDLLWSFRGAVLIASCILIHLLRLLASGRPPVWGPWVRGATSLVVVVSGDPLVSLSIYGANGKLQPVG